MAARRSSKEPPPPKPWRRESGSYLSSDERFTIESGGAGRWFMTDAESIDELGLARTIGPFDTLDAAKAAAGDRREQRTDTSPLADRLAAAKERPARTTKADAGGDSRKAAGHARRGKGAPETAADDGATDGASGHVEDEPR